MPANTPLVKNLNDPQYMRILLDGKASLEERFAEMDARLIRKELAKLSVSSDKVSPRKKKLIRRTDFPEQWEYKEKIMIKYISEKLFTDHITRMTFSYCNQMKWYHRNCSSAKNKDKPYVMISLAIVKTHLCS